MRTVAFFALLVFALPAAAGPIGSFQYDTSLNVFGLYGPGITGPGPATYGDEATYPIGDSPLFGITVASGWSGTTYPAHPSADFAFLPVGRVNPYIAGPLPTTDVSGSAGYFFSFAITDAAGRIGVVSLEGTFNVTWSSWGAFVYSSNSPRGSVVIVDTRYDVQLSFEHAFVLYQDHGNGSYVAMRFPTSGPPYQNGDYTSQYGVLAYATFTTSPGPSIAAPEPGTLALAAIGLGGVLVRRLRRA